ncbi:DUF1259 domain-containing protein [Cohnella caldifontis]|uniref:DUF1259 domain-containing protein n=1 Tax=Cohnella caldifontis TaxID=3027471 RepID=UPI0023EC3AEA|nr:DUF1259 domain-containing protein [Cohnella sp. YIM B05605]
MAMMIPSPLCQQFARILGGTAEVANGVCTVTRLRDNLRPLIEGRRTNSILALAAFFSFEDLDNRGNALNLGETVILQEEINPFISALRAQGIEVTALHNHWLFDDPRLMFIHFKSVEPPLSFAVKAANAFRVLTTRTVSPSRSSSSGGRSHGQVQQWGSCGCARSRGRSAGFSQAMVMGLRRGKSAGLRRSSGARSSSQAVRTSSVRSFTRNVRSSGARNASGRGRVGLRQSRQPVKR